MAIPVLKVSSYPNNEIRCVFYYARDKKEAGTPVQNPDPDRLLDITSKLETASTLGINTQGEDCPEDGEGCPEDGPKKGFGAPGKGKGFSTNGRRRLLRAGAVLDELADRPQQILFATGTLPGSTYEAKLAIAAWSGWAVHAVKAWFAKRVPGKIDMYVWEFQRRGALHLHYAILVKDDETRKRLLKEWKKQWERIIDGIGSRAGIDMWRKNATYTHANNKDVLQADIQECEKSIARYLSKYVSKSQQQYQNNHWVDCKPSRFWGISRPLCRELADRTEETEVVLANRRTWESLYEDSLSVVQSECSVEHHYSIPVVNARVIVGYCNPGERAWLFRRLTVIHSLKENSSEMLVSEQDRLCLLIKQSLCQSEMLRSFVEEFCVNGSESMGILTDLSESSSSEFKDSVILSYRYYIGHLIRTRQYVPDTLRRLHRSIVKYCMDNLGSLCTPTTRPPRVEPVTKPSEKHGNVQLTLGN